jgi:outer membrane protein assembly factor BamB
MLFLIDTKTGKADRSFPDADEPPIRAVSDGRGGWFIAGNFSRIGRVRRPGLARLNSNGMLDDSFVPDLPKKASGVLVAVAGKVVYADYAKQSGVSTAFGIVALDASTGRRLWLTRASGGIGEIDYGNGVLYVVGIFSKIGGVARHSVAALNPANGKPTAWKVQGRSLPSVNAVTVARKAVYLGGDFTEIAGRKTTCGVAAVSPKTGRTIWVPSRKAKGHFGGCTQDVDSIIVSHGQVLVGSKEFASFDLRTGLILPWSKRVFNIAYPYAISGKTVYLGGDNGYLFRVDGKRVNDLAAISLPSGKLTNWRPKLGRFGRCVSVFDLAVSGRKLLATGGFSRHSCD